MKEQTDKRRSKLAGIKSRRVALNSSHLGNDEFKSLGQASSELLLKLSKRAKVGAIMGGDCSKPPSKTTQLENVVYLNSNDVQNLRTAKQRNKAKHDQKKDDACELFYIFR